MRKILLLALMLNYVLVVGQVPGFTFATSSAKGKNNQGRGIFVNATGETWV